MVLSPGDDTILAIHIIKPMRRALTILAVTLPPLSLLFFALRPETDRAVPLPLGHFYVVTFTTFAAAVVSIMLTSALQEIAQPRHRLAARAFAFMGVLFFTHGVFTPGALTAAAHPAVTWSAWLTLLSGGLIFFLASLDRHEAPPSPWLRPAVHRGISLVIAGYLAVALFRPEWLTAAARSATPALERSIFSLTLALWLGATVRLVSTWQKSRSQVDGSLTLVAFWLTLATISMHQRPVWYLSWWFYHLVLLGAFLFTVFVLIARYEQARAFRLLRYYVATSLIVTTLLALVASALFAEFSRRTLIAEIERSTAALVDAVSLEVAETLPAGSNGPGALGVYAQRLVELPLSAVHIFDLAGQPVPAEQPILASASAENGRSTTAQSNGYDGGYDGYGGYDRFADYGAPPASQHDAGHSPAPDQRSPDSPIALPPLDPHHIREILTAGTLISAIKADPADDTGHSMPGVPAIHVYAPLLGPAGEPVGIVRAVRELPELHTALRQARLTGLATAAATMGLLFAALLLVVLRADRILVAREHQLSAANERLRRSEAIRADLSSMIVHDLRSPLTAIAVNLDLVDMKDEGHLSVEQRQMVMRARQAADRMNGLIGDILTVDKIGAGELQLNVRRTSLQALLSERVQELMPRALVEGKRLELDCASPLPVTMDPNLIGRVVDNLLSNAFKYTLEGEGHIRVIAEAGPQVATVRVIDNGEGIPDGYKTVIFDKFAQAPTVNRDGVAQRKGIGLGLAFCRLVIRAHGGDIWVEDASDQGSEFIFHLPIAGVNGAG